MLSQFKGKPAQKRGGLTLVELLIVLIVVGVLAALAVPSYLDAVRKARRTDAVGALLEMQLAQERWRSRHGHYTDQLTNLHGSLSTTPQGYYALSVTVTPETANSAYRLMATALNGSSQESDGNCAELTLEVTGAITKFSQPECWSR